VFAAIFSLQLVASEQGLVVCVVYVMQLFSLLNVFHVSCDFNLSLLVSHQCIIRSRYGNPLRSVLSISLASVFPAVSFSSP